jgi:ribosomal-protein-alanine N-acetyltransferase
MSVVQGESLAYRLRPIRREDIPQVSEIDKTCFPTMLPYTNYETELINPMAHYIVVDDDSPSPQTGNGPVEPLIPGFAGLWLLAGEAHIINIAVREEYRQEGLGELLLIGLIQKAQVLKAGMVTLEVRVSNTIAQHLYARYGFTERGRRRAYYTDDREDAVIMTVDDPCSPAYETVFQQLRQRYEKKWRRTTEISKSGKRPDA